MYRKSTAFVKLMHDGFFIPSHSRVGGYTYTISLGRLRVFPVIIGSPKLYLESSICLFLSFRVYVRGAAERLHQSYHPRPFVKCCYNVLECLFVV